MQYVADALVDSFWYNQKKSMGRKALNMRLCTQKHYSWNSSNGLER